MKKKHRLTRTNFRDLQELAENITRIGGRRPEKLKPPVVISLMNYMKKKRCDLER
jgi:hypothetical protein